MPPLSVTSAPPLSSPFKDSGNLAAYPGRVGGLVGLVAARTGTQETADPESLACANVRYVYYRVQVERYLFGPLPCDNVQLRSVDRCTHCGSGSEPYPRFPVSLHAGERYVFFPSDLSPGSALPGEAGDTFTVQQGPPAYEGLFQVSNGQMETCHGGRCGWGEPLADFEARIIQVACDAGRTVAQ